MSTRLDISSSGLTTLENKVPENITELRCSRNEITSLVPLKNLKLKSLGCSYNHLISLKGLPSTIETLVCVNNFLTDLQGTEECKFKRIYCSYNKITTLKHLQYAEILDCSCNLLTSIVSCPPNVIELIISNNQITSLQGIPDTVEILRCSDNPLLSLEYLPKNLRVLDVAKTSLQKDYIQTMTKNIEQVFY